ncbi:MAG: hypothetical protein GOVbin1709_33 [Prokaryotic dsDNA virus sp.]|nr:MAG: hypothetical protein GOVbin1709_33 [Prokaryotic dsDNA virus sp.]|tara:strand:+ start:1930 stop:2166 length:237 start_codon:yes stop_codon:yes gene_type:complete
MTEKNKCYYDFTRNLPPEDGISMVMCGKGSCKCPAVNIHKELEKVVLGGEEEGYSVWTKEQFKIMVENIKKGEFDEYI